MSRYDPFARSEFDANDVADVSDEGSPPLTVRANARLTAAERARLQSDRRPGKDEDLDEATHPIPKNATLFNPPPLTIKAETELSCCFRSMDEALSVSLSADATVAAVGYHHGSVDVLHVGGKSINLIIELPALPQKPTAALKFLPPAEGRATNILLAGRGDTLHHVHATTGQMMRTTVEEDNQIYSIALSPDGASAATAGTDTRVRIYDETTGKVTNLMEGGDEKTVAGHSNRIYSTCWSADDPNMIVTGGWDKTIQCWDLRCNHSVRSMYGPQVCGDALDMNGPIIMSGSWRKTGQLQLWDLRSTSLRTNLHLPVHEPEHLSLYAAKYLPGSNGGKAIVGGSGSQSMAVALDTRTGGIIGTIPTRASVYAVDVTDDAIAVVSRDQMFVMRHF